MRRTEPARVTDGGDAGQRAEGEFVVLVALANPKTESHLVTLGSAIANQRDGRVVAVTIVQVPDQTPLGHAREHLDHGDATDLLAGARRTATEVGSPVETHTIFSHNLFRAIFDAAERYEADACLLGWGEEMPGIAGRSEPLMEELAHSLPCDLLVYQDRGFDPSRILLPTTGGPHTDLAARVARILRAEFDAELTLLHVAEDSAAGESFLTAWANDRGLGDATLRVEGGDVETTIERMAGDQTLVLIGATEAGVLARLTRGALALDVLHGVDCSVLITERRSKRTLFQRLFQRR